MISVLFALLSITAVIGEMFPAYRQSSRLVSASRNQACQDDCNQVAKMGGSFWDCYRPCARGRQLFDASRNQACQDDCNQVAKMGGNFMACYNPCVGRGRQFFDASRFDAFRQEEDDRAVCRAQCSQKLWSIKFWGSRSQHFHNCLNKCMRKM